MDCCKSKNGGKFSDKLPPRRLFWASVAISFCGMAATAYGPIFNNPQTVIEQFVNESFYQRYGIVLDDTGLDIAWGALCATNPLGAMFGSAMIYKFCEYFGRRETTLTINGLFCTVAALLQFLAKDIEGGMLEFLYLGRFIAGIAFGLAGADSIYLVESAPDKFRGFVGAMPNIALTVWYTLACALGHPHVLGNENLWQYLMLWPAIPALLGILLALFMPESPKFLYLTKSDVSGAANSLEYFFGDEYDPSPMFEEYDRERKFLMNEPKPTWKAIWADVRLKRGLIVSFMTIVSLTTVGIEIVAQYSSTIFSDAGYDDSEAAIATTCTMFPALVIALILMPYIDRVGRRPMIITAMMGAALAHILLLCLLQYSAVAIMAVVLITVCHFAGVGPVGRFIVAEMCPQACRSKIAGVGWIGKWTLATIYTCAFPVLLNNIGQWTFTISAAFCIFFIIWFWRHLPETKQLAVDSIVDRFGLKRQDRVHTNKKVDSNENLMENSQEAEERRALESRPLIDHGYGSI